MGNTPATHAPKGGCTAGTKKATEEMLLSAYSSAAIRRYSLLLNIRYFTPPHGQKTARLRPLSAANASTVQFRKRSNIVQYIIFATLHITYLSKTPTPPANLKTHPLLRKAAKIQNFYSPPPFSETKFQIFFSISHTGGNRRQAIGSRSSRSSWIVQHRKKKKGQA